MNKPTLALCIAALVAPAALANPTGPQVVNGAVLQSNPSASVMQIVNTPGTIIHWQGFSISAGETARFVQQNAASAVLNRVVTANPSSILGRLESNGRVFLVNPNGIVFGSSAVVDVAGLIASTRDISNADFQAGNYLFSGAGSGTISIDNGAQILTSTYGPGGQVWLFAKDIVQQSGSSITTPQGHTMLAAGSQLQVTQSSLGNMNFNVTTAGGTIQTLGSIAADRGAVGMFADSITHGGSISAPSTAVERGSVVARATSHFTVPAGGQIHADGANGAISIVAGGTLKVEPLAAVTAAGTTGAGGAIELTASDMRVFPLTVHAASLSGAAGNVTVTQTQSSTYVPGATIHSAPVSNNIFGGVTHLEPQPDGSLRLFTAYSDGTQPTMESVSADVTSISSSGAAPPFTILSDLLTPWFYSPLAGGSVAPTTSVLSNPITIALSNPDGSVRANVSYPQSTNVSGAVNFQPMVGGGFTLGGNAEVRVINSGGALLRTHALSSLEFNTRSYGTGLPDGGYAATRTASQGQTITWFSQSGSSGGSVNQSLVVMLAPTATGFVAGGIASIDNNNCCRFDLTPYNKVMPAFTPLATASADLRAPQIQGSAPPPAPPVVQGSGSGATFGGVSGCNSSVCSDEVRAAIDMVSAQRAAENTAASGRIEQDAAERAVDALFRSAGREADAATTSGIAIIMKDEGEVRRLVQGDRLAKMTPGERLDALERWLQNEVANQSLGQTGTGSSVNEVNLVNAVSNMSQKEKEQFLENIVVGPQRLGVDQEPEIIERQPSTPEAVEDALTDPGPPVQDSLKFIDEPPR